MQKSPVPWYSLGESQWRGLGENAWYIMARKLTPVGLLLLKGGYGGLTELLIGLIVAPVRTMGVVLSLLVMACLSTLLLPTRLVANASRRAANRLAAKPLRCFGVGLLALTGLVLVAMPMLFAGSSIAQVLGILLWVSAFGAWLVGMRGLTCRTGQRLFRQQDTSIALRTLAKSSLLLTVAMFFPVLGWFVFAPLTMMVALGAGVVALWPKRRARQPFSVLQFQSKAVCS